MMKKLVSISFLLAISVSCMGMARLSVFIGLLRGASHNTGPIATVPFIWLDAAHVVKDGSNFISQWTDQSGNGHHMIQPDGTRQPTWVASGIHSLPSVQGDGTNKYLYSNSTGWFPPQMSVFYVIQSTTASDHRGILNDTNDVTNPTYFLSNLGQLEREGHFVIETSVDNIVASTMDTSPHLFAMTEDRSISNGLNAWWDRSQTLTNVGGSGIGANGYMVVLAANAASGGYWSGYISELLIYNSILSPSDVAAVELYLKTKYGTP